VVAEMVVGYWRSDCEDDAVAQCREGPASGWGALSIALADFQSSWHGSPSWLENIVRPTLYLPDPAVGVAVEPRKTKNGLRLIDDVQRCARERLIPACQRA